ncbi:MAG: hypothetical protein IJ792_04490 [Oscillospiraceae bacterium]|nr:hypothetical protein [Oscillospiraceae bacterium]
MTVMEESWQSAREILARAARQAGYLPPSPVPLRLQREEGVFLSALPRLLAARTGGDAQAAAEELAEACRLDGTVFPPSGRKTVCCRSPSPRSGRTPFWTTGTGRTGRSCPRRQRI